GERIGEDGVAIVQPLSGMELGAVRDERLRPAAARSRIVADHGAVADVAILRPPAQPIFAACAGGAGLEAALGAGEHRIDDDAVASGPRARIRAGLDDPADVLVAEREREGA